MKKQLRYWKNFMKELLYNSLKPMIYKAKEPVSPNVLNRE